jgi:predicted AAA+ superfamily ATPase
MTSYISRDIETPLREYTGLFPAVALTGPRQSGKSTTLRKLFEKSHAYLSFDDPEIRRRFMDDPQLFMDRCPDRVVFDEIQLLPQIVPYLKIAIDRDRERTGRFLLTGSNQFTLMKNLSESLAGRVGLLNLLPFGITEPPDSREGSARRTFTRALLRGLYPELVIKKWPDPADWYASYVQTYIERDVRLVQNIINVRDFHRFVNLLAARCAQQLNMSSLSRELGITVPTIRQWLSVLEASYIVFLLPPYAENRGKQVVKSPKVFFFDTGLVCYFTGMKTEEHVMNGPFAGALYENFCVAEFIKSVFHSNRKARTYFYRTRNGAEVDLVIDDDGALSLYECKMAKTVNRGMTRNIVEFPAGQKEVRRRVIVSLNDAPMEVARGVRALPLRAAIEQFRAGGAREVGAKLNVTG